MSSYLYFQYCYVCSIKKLLSMIFKIVFIALKRVHQANKFRFEVPFTALSVKTALSALVHKSFGQQFARRVGFLKLHPLHFHCSTVNDSLHADITRNTTLPNCFINGGIMVWLYFLQYTSLWVLYITTFSYNENYRQSI